MEFDIGKSSVLILTTKKDAVYCCSRSEAWQCTVADSFEQLSSEILVRSFRLLLSFGTRPQNSSINIGCCSAAICGRFGLQWQIPRHLSVMSGEDGIRRFESPFLFM